MVGPITEQADAKDKKRTGAETEDGEVEEGEARKRRRRRRGGDEEGGDQDQAARKRSRGLAEVGTVQPS